MPFPVGRFSLAFDDPALEPFPTWTRIDDTDNLVASYTIDRGRQFELDRTDAARATVQINDRDGVLDPTNTSGPYFGKIEPLLQAAICRWDPVAEEWQQRFGGWVDDWSYDFDPSQRVNRLTLQLVDIFEMLAAIEMAPGAFGDDPTTDAPSSIGQVWFDSATMDARIIQVLANSGIPEQRYVVFSGNVSVIPTTYSPGESPMSAIQEAADAEFPGVSNVYTDRFGRLAVHGRLAKVDPSGTAATTAYAPWSGATTYVAGDHVASGGHRYECILGHTNHIPPNATYWEEVPEAWDWHHWHAGDGAAVQSAPSITAPIREFSFNRGLSSIRNSALATPLGIADADVAGQLVQDLTSINDKYGIRSWSAQNLITQEGLLDASTALEETLKFAEYVVDNYANARDRISKIVFRPMRSVRTAAAVNWRLLSQVDIGDQIDVTISSPGGGGFTDEECFVEGIHEDCKPLNDEMDDVTLRLDLSPKALFDSNPFPVS